MAKISADEYFLCVGYAYVLYVLHAYMYHKFATHGK